MADRCSVGSLSEYIAAIEKYNLFQYISRGESRAYDHPLRCSIYRHDLDKYTQMLEQYHLDVETSISAIQDKNFLAFAQHHGLPTNLLDFSFSPLVSLYFSATGCEDRGFVYFVKKARLVNINKVIYDKPLGWGMFEELLNYDEGLFREILPQMSDVFLHNKEEMTAYFEHHALGLIAEYRRYQAQGLIDPDAGGVDDFERMIRQYEEWKAGWPSDDPEGALSQLRGRSSSMLKSMQKILKGDPAYPASFYANYRKVVSHGSGGARYTSIIHLMMFVLKLEEMECYSKTILDPANPVYELEFPFYFTYHPPVIDDRVRNQYSVFIFQPFAENKVTLECSREKDSGGLGSNCGGDYGSGSRFGSNFGGSGSGSGFGGSGAVSEEDGPLAEAAMEAGAGGRLRGMGGMGRSGAGGFSGEYGGGGFGSNFNGGGFGAGAQLPRSTEAQIWQKISPDFIMEIRNPQTIRRELDAIGINSKNIYCDYDSIADYIVTESDERW